MKLVLTCEHAGNKIMGNFRHLFEGERSVLKTHRGYDPGAFDLYKALVPLGDFKAEHMESRLLIEVNRSLHHPLLFSEFTRHLSLSEKKKLIEGYYLPYRNSVETAIRTYLRTGEEVLHFSVHSFTPQFHGKVRNADIGLLYDPGKQKEKEFCKRFKGVLKLPDPTMRVRFNYPYLGKADGFTTYLRKRFPQNYSGIELEVNQKYVFGNKMEQGIKLSILEALQKSLK